MVLAGVKYGIEPLGVVTCGASRKTSGLGRGCLPVPLPPFLIRLIFSLPLFPVRSDLLFRCFQPDDQVARDARLEHQRSLRRPPYEQPPAKELWLPVEVWLYVFQNLTPQHLGMPPSPVVAR